MSSYYTNTNLFKWTLLKTPEKSTRSFQFTKHLTPPTLEGNTLIHLQKWWDAIRCAYFQSMSTNNCFPTWKLLQETDYNLTKYVLPPPTHSKISTKNANYQVLYRSFIFNIVKDTTIKSSTASKSHIKLITCTNNENVFDLLVPVVFSMIPQIGGIGPKVQDFVTSFKIMDS